ncbi:MAG: thioesterase family protein [Acidimicrobiia bacterium]
MAAEVTVKRRVEWMDTDAAGIWHHSTVIRWAEDAEAELHRRLGIVQRTFGATPRVNIEFNYGVPLRFDDEVDVNLKVGAMGETSITYEVSVNRDGDTLASGRMVAVLIDRTSGAKKPWPEDMRRALMSPGA